MDPFLWRTISYWVVFIGTAMVLGGSIGTWYFGSQAEQLAPFRQPIRTAVATVEIIIESAEAINTTYTDQGGYLALGRGTQPILTTAATECMAQQLGNNRLRFRGVFAMDANDTAAGKSVSSLRNVEFVQISFVPMQKNAHVLQGTAVVTINSTVRLDFVVPEQNAQDGRMFVRDVEGPLSQLR